MVYGRHTRIPVSRPRACTRGPWFPREPDGSLLLFRSACFTLSAPLWGAAMGLGFKVWGSGFRVWGLDCDAAYLKINGKPFATCPKSPNQSL